MSGARTAGIVLPNASLMSHDCGSSGWSLLGWLQASVVDLVDEDVVSRRVKVAVRPGPPELDGRVRDAGLVVLGARERRVELVPRRRVEDDAGDAAVLPSYAGVVDVVQRVVPLAPVDPALVAFRGHLVEQQAASESRRQRRDIGGVELVVQRHPGAGEAPEADLGDEEPGERAQKLRVLVDSRFRRSRGERR